jgi:hypothetical protein
MEGRVDTEQAAELHRLMIALLGACVLHRAGRTGYKRKVDQSLG